jgi:hypothetical protein
VVPALLLLKMAQTALGQSHLKDLIEKSSDRTRNLPGLPKTFSLTDQINLSTVVNLPALAVINRKDPKLVASTQTKAQNRSLREVRSQAMLLSARKDTLRLPSLPSATLDQTQPPVSCRLQPHPRTP